MSLYFSDEGQHRAAHVINYTRLTNTTRRSITNSSSNNNYLPQLKKDLIDVITKYVAIDENSVNVNLEQSATNDILEINIGLNDGNNRRILDA